jgi:hypothetical protein
VPLRRRIASRFQFSDAPPQNVRWVAILFVARDLAGAAANALHHVEVKTILLAFG